MKNETKVVNLKTEEYDTYIGRGSIWGNPFRIGQHGTREEVIVKYRKYILNSPEKLARLPWLKGKRLGCFCVPLRCHGQVLLDILQEKYSSNRININTLEFLND